MINLAVWLRQIGSGAVSFGGNAIMTFLQNNSTWLTGNALLHAIFSGHIRKTVAKGLTAGTTQTQAGGLQLAADINIITVSVNDADSVVMPLAAEGLDITIVNDDSAQDIKIWPAVGDKMNGGTTDAADTTALGETVRRRYVAEDDENWITI